MGGYEQCNPADREKARQEREQPADSALAAGQQLPPRVAVAPHGASDLAETPHACIVTSRRSGPFSALVLAPVDREPAAWETNAAGPFLGVGEVAVYALGEDRIWLVSPAGEREVEGFELARQLAHELAGV